MISASMAWSSLISIPSGIASSQSALSRSGQSQRWRKPEHNHSLIFGTESNMAVWIMRIEQSDLSLDFVQLESESSTFELSSLAVTSVEAAVDRVNRSWMELRWKTWMVLGADEGSRSSRGNSAGASARGATVRASLVN